MDIVYRSFDGEYFDDELECIMYENDLLKKTIKKEKCVFFFDKNGNAIEYNGEDGNFFNNVKYIYVKNKEGLEVIQGIKRFFHVVFPTQIGLFFWDNNSFKGCGSYVNVEAYIPKAEKFLHVTTELKEKIRNGKIDFD